jgi:two-component system, cell cycle sensor histidine kinase and response regulator CckA
MSQLFNKQLQIKPAITKARTSEEIKAEIELKLGFVPPFFAPAEQTPQVLENLWQQTLIAYLNNPLPTLFKEKLSAYLSRFCAVPYCMICHSCSLRPLGMKASEVLELLEAPVPNSTDIEKHLSKLAAQSDFPNIWPEPNSQLEESLLYCSIFIALPNSSEHYRQQLRRILGVVKYQHLVAFIAYIKTCHVWMEAHPEVAYEADKRVIDHLGAILSEEPSLVDFFRNYREYVKRECQTRAEQLALVAERRRTEETLRQQAEREQLVAGMAQRIRQSLNLGDILSTTVSEVRQFLQTERVFIYRFEPDWGGYVAVESVADSCAPILGMKVTESFFEEPSNRSFYQQGRFQAVEDIYTVGLSKCHVDFLARLQIRANLVVPIVQGGLWGLLVANHCSSPRKWQQLEIDLLKQLATQVAIAIQQSTLFEQVKTELTERKRSEEKIREQAALLNIASDAINVQTLDNQILFWNKSAERVYGWKQHEAVGKNANQLLYKEMPQLEQFQHVVVESGFWEGELHQVSKFGKEIIVSSRWTLVRDEQGQPKSILVVNTDITEKKLLEAQFLRSQRLESIGTLASGIAHDLNNALGPILMIAELLQEKFSDAHSKQLLIELEASAKRGASLVKQVLSFGRGIEGKRTIIQVKHLLSEIEQIAKQTFPKSIKIYTDISPNLWTVCADATQMHQVLMNLVLNARDGMPHGGTLSIYAENLFIDEQYAHMNVEANVGNYIMLTVSDTGVGIPDEILQRIFEPFFTTKEVGKGTGLGLSTVIGIIKNHGGFVNVYSEMGLGTQFKVYLPAVEGALFQQAEDLEYPRGHGELVLVVDDELSIREITKISLEMSNYKVLTACDGIEAIALYAQHKNEISIILMDMMMPDMDGLTTIRTLQRINSQIKIIATSGLASTDRMAEAADVGAKAFLSKPYTAAELLKALSSILNIK